MMVNKIALSILSLLSREPLSGYDIKQQMNDRINHFLKVNNNQVYPQIRHLEEQKLIRLAAVMKTAQHPAKKIYEITAEGLVRLKEYATMDFGDAVIKDGFLFKIYNSWLLDDDALLMEINKEKEKHLEKIKIFRQKIGEVEKLMEDKKDRRILSSLSVLKYGEIHERAYIEWCEDLEKNRKESKDTE